MTRTALALSGGGHRATAFALGALLYLTDAGRNAGVTSIASVSGGSIANAYVGQCCDYRQASPSEFEDVAGELARRIARRGTLWASAVTWAYVLLLAGLVVSAVLAACFLDDSWLTRWVTAAMLLFAAGALGTFRGAVCDHALRRTLYHTGGRPTRLSVLARPGIDHVLCAAELHYGEHFYFSGRFVGSYRTGVGQGGDLPLATAVQCSAAFPGGFPVRWLRARRFKFVGAPDDCLPSFLVLLDGGIYDNMADQWAWGLTSRQARCDVPFEPADELIVINAAAPLLSRNLAALEIPILGELLTLLRVQAIMYDNTTAARRERLVDRFDRSAKAARSGADGDDLMGAIVAIKQTPFAAASRYREQPHDWPDRARRSEAVYARFGAETAEGWKRLADSNSACPTTLRSLGVERTADLLYQGYCVAMANLHVVLGYPLLAVPDRGRFVRLLRDPPSAEPIPLEDPQPAPATS